MLETFVPMQIKTSGASIHVMKGGSGEPLLLLHGFPQTHVMWHKIAPRRIIYRCARRPAWVWR
jgi:haloacetate dehalogenase